jgi:hypothetical protein
MHEAELIRLHAGKAHLRAALHAHRLDLKRLDIPFFAMPERTSMWQISAQGSKVKKARQHRSSPQKYGVCGDGYEQMVETRLTVAKLRQDDSARQVGGEPDRPFKNGGHASLCQKPASYSFAMAPPSPPSR